MITALHWGERGEVNDIGDHGRLVGMARDADLVARFNGGDNAGHTVVV